jgi:cyclin H
MNEDDLYRTSTQFRLWSYTEKGLADIRSTTNSLATTRVRDAIKRLRAKEGKTGEDEVDCLSVEEEQKLVGFYCSKAMDFSDFCNYPTAVKVK